MEQDTATTETPESQAVVQELVRPRQGRMLGGVAQGLANRYNLPVLLVRALFVILTFGGGLGLALYGAGWFLIRSEDEPEAPAERFFSQASTSRSWIGIGLVFLAVLILLDRFTFLSGGVVWAVGLLVVGILLYTGDLPRLVQGQNDKEGVQQVTTSSTLVPTEPTASG
ncbi:MAG: PspC domain-containing protein, partial [Acidimicrobiia bacterium]